MKCLSDLLSFRTGLGAQIRGNFVLVCKQNSLYRLEIESIVHNKIKLLCKL